MALVHVLALEEVPLWMSRSQEQMTRTIQARLIDSAIHGAVSSVLRHDRVLRQAYDYESSSRINQGFNTPRPVPESNPDSPGARYRPL